jgi:hypothetical protein
MFIFRMEHERNVCQNPFFKAGGESITGHGTYRICSYDIEIPNFGLAGDPPATLMMEHERCAVNALQFDNWISKNTDYDCRMITMYCQRIGQWCIHCKVELPIRLTIPAGWDILAYWVEDEMENIDWRYDRGQIVFNPEFAICMGKVTYKEVIAIRKEWQAQMA